MIGHKVLTVVKVAHNHSDEKCSDIEVFKHAYYAGLHLLL